MNDPQALEEELAPVLRWHFRQADEGRCDREVELARYAAGDLTSAERLGFEQHLAGCAECGGDLAEHRVDTAAHAFDPPEARRGLPWRELLRIGPWSWAVVGAAALAAFFLVRPGVRDAGTLHVKGRAAFELQVAAAHGGRTFRLAEGARLAPGDQLGFFYSAPTSGYLVVAHASPDEVTRIFPASGGGGTPVAAGREVRIPDGVRVSPGQGCAWFIGLFSRRALGEEETSGILRRMVAERSGCRLGPVHVPDVEAQSIGVRQ
jgi:hypothetical protein